MWVDRRDWVSSPRLPEDCRAADQWRFDGDDGGDEPPMYELDPFDDDILQWRFKKLGLPRMFRRPGVLDTSFAGDASAGYQRTIAVGGDQDVSPRQARLTLRQQPNGQGPSWSHTRATMVPVPMQAPNEARQLPKMAPPILPQAQKA